MFTMNDKKIIVLIFIVAFCYMYVFTSGIPFFWDDHEFHQGFYEKSLKNTVLAIFSPNESALDTTRPVYGLFFKFLFFFFKFNFEMYRLFKALIFAAAISVAFILSKEFIASLKTRLLFITVVIFSFPIYIHTLVFDEPFIIAELFKLVAIFLFLKDFENKKSSIKTQAFIFLLTLLAIRTYNPSASLIILFFVFILLFNFDKLKKYWILLASFVLISFPYNRLISLNFSGPHGTNFINLYKFFFEGNLNYIFSPMINFNYLYYKPAIATLSFFGFWFFIFLTFFIIYLFSKDNKMNQIIFNKQSYFLIIWFIAELPLLISLPEHAIRYLSAFIIPFYLLLFYLADKIILNRSKYIYYLIFILVIGIVLTNLTYTTAFRIGWGSSFIANQKALNFIESQNTTNFTAIYFAQSAAYEFVPLNKSNSGYKIKYLARFVMTSNLSHFSEEHLSKLPYERVYVIQKISANGRTILPQIDFNSRSDLKLLESFSGIDGSLFDFFSSFLNHFFKKEAYSKSIIYLRK